jgi:long-chain fatty acid transport protein
LVVVVVLAAAPAFASGFGFYENGAKASAQGGAWVARADDVVANWYNPAALVHLTGREVQFGINYLETGSDTQFRQAPGVSFDTVGNVVTPAHFYYSPKINDRVARGVGLNSPFGLVSEWNDFPLTSSSRRAELRTYLLNPNIAFKLSKERSFAFGVDYLSAEVREFSHDETATVDLTGEGDAWGCNVALQFKTENFSIAEQYCSALAPKIDTNITFGGVLVSAATARLDLPGQSMLGAAWTGKRVDIEVGGYYTQWNYFKRLDVEAEIPALSSSLNENWEGTWSYRPGLAFRLGEEMKNEFRVGGVFDETPVPVQYLRPSIPDADRTGYTLGYGCLSKKSGIDVYAMYLDFATVTATGPPADGVIPGTYTTTIVLAGVTAKYRL